MPRRLLHLRPWRRHSVVLFVAGVVYLCYGFALLAVSPNDSRRAGLVVASEVMPIRAWGFVWIVVGALALASTRWPPQSETWGYAAMSGLAAFWSACYGFAIALGEAPPQNVTAFLVWAMVSFLWWAVAGLANPDDLHKPINFDWSLYRQDSKRRRQRVTRDE